MKCALSISRNNHDKVVIRIEDVGSRIEFVQVELSLEQYAQAITGLNGVEGAMTVRHLEYVGTQRIVEQRQAKYTGAIERPTTKDLRRWLQDHCVEPGWTLNDGLNDQRSVQKTADGDGILINYQVIKFVEVEAQS